MATIKIDRGFTQKIQQKGLIHSPNQEPAPHPKKPHGSKKGPPVALLVTGVVGLLALGAVAIVLALGGKEKPKKGTAAPVAVAPAALPAAAPAVQPAAADEIVDPEQEIYAQHSGKPAPQTAQPQAPKQDTRPVWREVPVGNSEGLLCEYYENIPGKTVNGLRSADAFPSRPSRTVQVTHFELSENIGNQYGIRVRGYLLPPASGKYRFSVCGDDAVEFWLSEDDSPARLRKRVSYGAWAKKYEWTDREDQQSAECELAAGQRYYLEAFLKEDSGSDYLCVAWKGPVSEKYTVIKGAFLQPWTDTPAATPSAGEEASARSESRQARAAALAPARAAVAEQQQKNAAAYRYAEAAEALKRGRSAWTDPEALELVETAILRFELQGRLRALLQAELAKAPARGVWTAFGGQADVTSATDEGVTVAPGRIVAWSKIPSDQMLRLVNAVVPRTVADPNTKGVLYLAAAVMTKEHAGGIDRALKYREHAVAHYSGVASLADRVLGGTPEALQAGVRMNASRAELARLAATASGLADKVAKLQNDLAAITGLVPGLLVEYWERDISGSLADMHKKGLFNRQPESTQVLDAFETPKDRAEKFAGRISGYLTPPETGEYIFYLAADDEGELWLSPDETPEKKTLCLSGKLIKYHLWDKEKGRSDPVRLVKGQHYYVEGYYQEGQGGDHLCVAWSLSPNDDPKVVGASNLLYSATAGFTPHAQTIRQQLSEDLKKVQLLISEGDRVRAADQAWAESAKAASDQTAEELQRQVTGVKEALRDAENLMKQIDATLPQLKTASRPS
jgi:hypothetical protein